MKRFIGALALLALMGSAQATEVRVDFGFFDSAKVRGEKFKKALPLGAAISALVLQDKRIEIGEDWLILGSGSSLGEVREEGGPLSTRDTASGYLYLGKRGEHGYHELMYLQVSLQGRIKNEYLTSTPSVCKKGEPFEYQDIVSAEEKKMSCIGIALTDIQAEIQRSEPFQAAHKVLGERLFPADAGATSKLYAADYFESRNANHFYLYHIVRAENGASSRLNQETTALRQQVQQQFF